MGSSFNFKKWMKDCLFTPRDVARFLDIPLQLVGCYRDEEVIVPLKYVKQCEIILERIRKLNNKE